MTKYAVIFFLLLIHLSSYSQVKNAGCVLRVNNSNSTSLTVNNDSINVDFRFNYLNYFCELKITNNSSNKPMVIDWDKFTMMMEGVSHSIIFDDSYMINKNNSRAISVIQPGASCIKRIAPVEYIELNMPLYTKGWVKKKGTQCIRFSVPFSFDDNIDYLDCNIFISLK